MLLFIKYFFKGKKTLNILRLRYCFVYLFKISLRNDPYGKAGENSPVRTVAKGSCPYRQHVYIQRKCIKKSINLNNKL